MAHALELVLAKLADWLDAAVRMLPNLAVAIAVLVGFWLLARVLTRAFRGPLLRATESEELPLLTLRFARFAITMLGVVIALGVLRLQGTVSSILAGVGILGLAIGFAFQEVASNFIAGIVLAFRRPYRNGQVIKVGDFFGTIVRSNLQVTVGRTFDGLTVYLPNKDVVNNFVTNYMENGERRVDITVGVAYGDDLDVAEKTALEAIARVDERNSEREPEATFEGFGDSAIDLEVRFWIDPSKHNFLTARHQAIKAIKRAFDDAGISIPFPIRTLEVDSRLVKALARPNGQAPPRREPHASHDA
ncbi:MAG: mechanosensitive ion channel family protein [Polyangiales bacterium]|nr:mechanosensitive ion channel family protein [Myxococcales bacterium]